jgi:AraC-like DNA-binding protein
LIDVRDAILELALDSLRFECLDYGIARMTLNMSTGWRSLPFAATSFCHSGRSLLRFDGGSCPVRRNETICLAPAVHHSADIPVRHTVTCWNHVHWKVFGAIPLLDLFNVPLVISGKASRKIGAVNFELLAVMAKPAGFARSVNVRALGLSLLSLILGQSQPRTDSVRRFQALSRLAPVLQIIDQQLDQPVTRDNLADIAHLSTSRFNAVFKAALRQSPREYIQKRRLQRAQQLLISTDLAIHEIAARVGHPDPFHFTRMFKQKCGVNPSQYRQNAREVRL